MANIIARQLRDGVRALAVEVAEVSGSSPRDRDAMMIVTDETISGTIGGGALEWTAVEHARDLLHDRAKNRRLTLPLGPLLGQCCGGRVVIDFRDVDTAYGRLIAQREASVVRGLAKVIVFGAGHVGRALAGALLPLPFRSEFVDTRETELRLLPAEADGRLVDDPLDVLLSAETETSFVIMTHTHIQDFILLESALRRSDAPYIGMIGSATKRASFLTWARGQRDGVPVGEAFTCPIGGSGVADKRPAVIAALVAAELLAKVHAPLVERQRNLVIAPSAAREICEVGS